MEEAKCLLVLAPHEEPDVIYDLLERVDDRCVSARVERLREVQER
jgi:hypothetical protein